MQQSVRGAEVQPGSSDALPGSAAWLSSVGVGGRAALQSARLASRSSNPDAREQSHSSYLQSTAGHSVLGLCTAAQLHQLSHRNRRLYHCRVGQAKLHERRARDVTPHPMCRRTAMCCAGLGVRVRRIATGPGKRLLSGVYTAIHNRRLSRTDVAN